MQQPRLVQRIRDWLAGMGFIALLVAQSLVAVHQYWRQQRRKRPRPHQ